MSETAVFRTPLGNMRLVMSGGAVTELGFTDEPENGAENEGVRQVLEYFAGTRREFSLPLRPRGTPFHYDGEPVRMPSEIRIKARPQGLKVIVP